MAQRLVSLGTRYWLMALLIAAALAVPVLVFSDQPPAEKPDVKMAEAAKEVKPEAKIDKQGSIGFGFGLDTSVTTAAFPFKISPRAAMRIWASDFFAVEPRLKLFVDYTKPGSGDGLTAWQLDPGILFDMAVYRGKSTRFIIGVGLDIGYGQSDVAGSSVADGDTNSEKKQFFLKQIEQYQHFGSTKTSTVALTLPELTLGVEHYFADWFSINVGADLPILTYSMSKAGDADATHHVRFALDNTALFLQLFFYTD